MIIHDEWIEIDDSVRAAVSRAMDGRTDSGFDEESIAAAEREMSTRLGYPHVLLTSSGTAGAHAVFLHCALAGLDRAILPVHVYPAIAGAAATAGLAPQFIPVDENLVSALPREDIGGVKVIHLPWGDVKGPVNLLHGETDRVIVLDVSHATPRIPASVWGGENSRQLYAIGSLGPGKFLSGLEMGFVATDDTESLRGIAALGAVRRHRHFGVYHPIATKLRPHPLAVPILQAQLARLDEKLEAHDETWNYLAPRLNEIEGIRVVTTSGPHERIYWRCLLEIAQLDGTSERAASLVAALRDKGIPVSSPEYLDDAVSMIARQYPSAPISSDVSPMPRLYVCLPGFIRLGRASCDRLLRELVAGLRDAAQSSQPASI